MPGITDGTLSRFPGEGSVASGVGPLDFAGGFTEDVVLAPPSAETAAGGEQLARGGLGAVEASTAAFPAPGDPSGLSSHGQEKDHDSDGATDTPLSLVRVEDRVQQHYPAPHRANGWLWGAG